MSEISLRPSCESDLKIKLSDQQLKIILKQHGITCAHRPYRHPEFGMMPGPIVARDEYVKHGKTYFNWLPVSGWTLGQIRDFLGY